MRALLEDTWSRVGALEASFVERLLVRGALGGSVGALVGFGWLTLSGAPRGAWGHSLPVAFATAACLVALPRQSLVLRVVALVALDFALLVLGSTSSTLPFVFSVALGLLLALEPLPAWRRLLVAVLPSLGVAWALFVARWLGARHLGTGAALAFVPLLGAGLFVGAASCLAWLAVAPDAVEPRLTPGSKVRQAWQRLRGALARLGDGPERDELRALATEGVERWLGARAEVEAVLATVDQGLELESRAAVDALTQRLAETTDPELKGHLEQLLRVHRDTLEQLDGLRRKADRADARAAAEAGWLETAAFTLELAPRGGSTRELVSRLRALRA